MVKAVPRTSTTCLLIRTLPSPTGSHFDLVRWKGDGGASYSLSVDKGKIESTRADHSIY